MIDIQNRTDLFIHLDALHQDALPKFGKMTAQHMVEHLSFVVKISNGKLPHRLYIPEERAARWKQVVIYTNAELPIGFRAPMLGDKPSDLLHENLPAAIEDLKKELADFDEFFSKHKEATPMNPTLGALDCKEWILFHNKHFTHHFKQFEIG